jgi:hypothetical protein
MDGVIMPNQYDVLGIVTDFMIQIALISIPDIKNGIIRFNQMNRRMQMKLRQ